MTDRAAIDSAALAWAATLAEEEGIQLVDDGGRPLPTAAIALTYELARKGRDEILQAALAEEGIQLVADDGQPLPTAALALAFEMAREAEGLTPAKSADV